jgi:ubiquinone/menaquinone biosynthesis C-methylase UbiE
VFSARGDYHAEMRIPSDQRDGAAETIVRDFYETDGWSNDEDGHSLDAQLWEDLRPVAAPYVAACRRKLLAFLPTAGDRLLDAASGPIQYPEYLEYSAGFRKRVCVDISSAALAQAQAKLGDRGEYHQCTILDLPFADDEFDAVLSMHTIYHIDRDEQETAVRQLVRVARRGAPVVIVYANPNRLLLWLKRSVTRQRNEPTTDPLYYFAHPLGWWKRFADLGTVELHPWRSLTAKDSRTLIPFSGAAGRLAFGAVGRLENALPRITTRWGAYPVVVIRKQ